MAKIKREKKSLIKEALLPPKMITIENRRSLVMEGCERIVLCESEKMVLQGKMQLEICGKNLHLKELGNDNMRVEGKLDSIHFCGEEKE